MHDVPSTVKKPGTCGAAQKGMLGQNSPSGKRVTNGHKVLRRN